MGEHDRDKGRDLPGADAPCGHAAARGTAQTLEAAFEEAYEDADDWNHAERERAEDRLETYGWGQQARGIYGNEGSGDYETTAARMSISQARLVRFLNARTTCTSPTFPGCPRPR